MGVALCLLAFVGAWAMARKNLGHGLGFVLAVGCCYGWLRANVVDGLTHFSFDAALGGLYLSALPRLPLRGAPGSRLVTWAGVLVGWPFIIILISPFLDAQHIFVQISGLRNAVLFVPLLLIGQVVTSEDLLSFGSWSEWCILGVSGFALGEFLFGLEVFFPLNELTTYMYAGTDVAGEFRRLPASFGSAHAYGGTMVALLPVLVGRLERIGGRRLLTITATALAALGIFACGARSPVVIFAFVMAAMLLRLRKKPIALVLVTAVMGAVGYAVSQSERLERFETLVDMEMVGARVAGSVNMSFWQILADYPMGKGLGSAFGTSVPFFLAEYAKPPIGIESEFGRILLEEGLLGLMLWMGFVISVLVRSASKVLSGTAEGVGMWVVCATCWASGLIGAGFLSSIPETLLFMMYLGMLALERDGVPKGGRLKRAARASVTVRAS